MAEMVDSADGLRAFALTLFHCGDPCFSRKARTHWRRISVQFVLVTVSQTRRKAASNWPNTPLMILRHPLYLRFVVLFRRCYDPTHSSHGQV